MKATLHQICATIYAANPDIRLYLLHGPDEAGAMEIAMRLSRAMGADAERVDLEPSLLKAHPGRLAEEAASMSLFGSARHIRVSGAGEECLEAFTLLLAADRPGNPAVAIAPTLKGTARIVKLALASRHAMSLACYVPEGAEAERLAIGLAREHGLRPTGGGAARLVQASGGDRAVMTREVEKLALYLDASPERPRELDDAALDAIGADVGDSAVGRAIDAAIEGRPDVLGAELRRLDTAGVSPIPVLRQLVRRLIALAELQAQIGAGVSSGTVIERVFFRERATIARALRCWPAIRITAAIDRTRRTERAIMATGTAGTVLAHAVLLSVARLAARQR